MLGWSPDEGSIDNKIIGPLTSNLVSKEFFCGAAAGAWGVVTGLTRCRFAFFKNRTDYYQNKDEVVAAEVT